MEAGVAAGCSEALFTMGESPWAVSGFSSLLAGTGVSDIIDYLLELCEMALETGLFPHTNAGILCQDDLCRLKPFNASMGLMLESTARLAAHVSSPGKSPETRLQFIAAAGRLKIPFTTGILIGIGESEQDRMDSLQRIADLQRRFGHIQEVIISRWIQSLERPWRMPGDRIYPRSAAPSRRRGRTAWRKCHPDPT